MASNNYTQAINNSSFYGQSTYLPLIGTQSGVQSNMSMTYPAQWNTYSDVQFSADSYLNFDSESFTTDEDNSSVASSLHNASKKISKASQGSKSSQKRSKRGRNPWTPKEDAQLMELMKKYGQSWAMISSVMEGRTGKQVRDRYLNKLRPNIKCGDWSPQEDELVVSLCKEIGHRWSLIANHLPGRTEGQVKNRFYSHIKKRLQPDGTYSHSSSRAISEGTNSFAASPQEETRFEFGQEFDANMLSTANPIPSFQAKGFCVVDNDNLSESTTQSPASQKDFTPAMIYDTTDSFFCSQPQQTESFYLPSMINDSNVDEMLNNVTNYFVGSSDVDSYFAEDLRSEEKITSAYACQQAESERLEQLNKRKAYLELALAKTLKEMKGF